MPTPSARRRSTLRCVAAFCHISTFIAGATMRGQRRARQSAESRSSPSPFATLARKSVVAGATTTTSRSRESSMWPMLSGTRASHMSVCTGWPESGLQRRRRDEATRRLGHDDAHVGAGLDEKARQLGRLVGGDSAGDPEQNPLSGNVRHRG